VRKKMDPFQELLKEGQIYKEIVDRLAAGEEIPEEDIEQLQDFYMKMLNAVVKHVVGALCTLELAKYKHKAKMALKGKNGDGGVG